MRGPWQVWLRARHIPFWLGGTGAFLGFVELAIFIFGDTAAIANSQGFYVPLSPLHSMLLALTLYSALAAGFGALITLRFMRLGSAILLSIGTITGAAIVFIADHEAPPSLPLPSQGTDFEAWLRVSSWVWFVVGAGLLGLGSSLKKSR